MISSILLSARPPVETLFAQDLPLGPTAKWLAVIVVFIVIMLFSIFMVLKRSTAAARATACW